MNEFEIVQHRQMEGISLFFNTVDYRTPHVHPEWELIMVLDHPLAVTCAQRELVLQPGQLVQLPFGRANRRCEGVVLAVESGDESGLKVVERGLDEQPVLTALQLKMAVFLRERYFCTFYDGVRAILPAGLWFQTKAVYFLTEDRSWETAAIRQSNALPLLRQLEALGGSAEESVLRQPVPDEEELKKTLSYLLRKKWIDTQTDVRRKASDRT